MGDLTGKLARKPKAGGSPFGPATNRCFGWRKPVNELYPGDSIIELAMEKGIPFTTASDAHAHIQLGDKFANLAHKMADIGIRQVCIFEKHKHSEMPLQL